MAQEHVNIVIKIEIILIFLQLLRTDGNRRKRQTSPFPSTFIIKMCMNYIPGNGGNEATKEFTSYGLILLPKKNFLFPENLLLLPKTRFFFAVYTVHVAFFKRFLFQTRDKRVLTAFQAFQAFKAFHGVLRVVFRSFKAFQIVSMRFRPFTSVSYRFYAFSTFSMCFIVFFNCRFLAFITVLQAFLSFFLGFCDLLYVFEHLETLHRVH